MIFILRRFRLTHHGLPIGSPSRHEPYHDRHEREEPRRCQRVTAASSFRETITAAHHSPEFRKKWPQFGKIAEEIDPCLYDLVHVEAA